MSKRAIDELLRQWQKDRDLRIRYEEALKKIIGYYDKMPKSHGYFYAEDIARAAMEK